MTGKPRSNDESFEAFQLNFNSKVEGYMSQNSNEDHGQFFMTPPPEINQKVFLSTAGGVMNGAIGFNASKIQIISNTIDIGADSGKYAGVVILESETGFSDVLSTIDNFQLSFQGLTLLAKEGHTITIDNVGNIDVSTSITLTNQQYITLRFDIIANKWKVDGVSGGVAFSGNLSDLVIDVNKDWLNFSISNLGGLTMSGDIDVSTFDVLNIDRAIFADDGSSITASNITQMLLNSSGSFQTNTDTGNDFVWTINNITVATFSEDNIFFRLADAVISTLDVDLSNNGVLTIQSPDDTGGAVIQVFRNDTDGGMPSPIVIGSYAFLAGTTLASSIGEYASIQGIAVVTTSGAIEGSMDLLAADGGGAQSVFISINSGANNLVDIFKVVDMNDNNILMGTGTVTFDSSNIVIGSPIANLLNIEFPAAGELHLFYNFVDVWEITSGAIIGPSLILSNNLVINDSTTDPVGDGIFSRNGSNLGFQLPQFTLQNETTTGADVAEFSLLKIDPGSSGGDNIGEVNFSVFDTPTATKYARILAKINDPLDAGTLQFDVMAAGVQDINAITITGAVATSNRTFVSFNTDARIASDLKFQVPAGFDSLKIFPAANELGIVVQDNVSFNVGDLGTLAIPISGTAPANAAQADTFFGSHKGAEGIFDNGSGTITKFLRQVDGNWASETGWTRDSLT